MTIPIQPANINPQVHQTEDPFTQQFLQALLQGSQLGIRQQELELNKARLKAEMAKQKFEELQFQSGLSQAAATAPALKESILQTLPQEQINLPAILGAPPASFTAATGNLAAEIRRMEPTAVPAFVQLAEPQLKAAREARIAEQQRREIERFVGQMPADKQAAMRGWMTLKASGYDVPSTMLAEVFPELVAGGVDPAAMNAAANIGTRLGGAVDFGMVRRQLGLPKMMGGIPDDTPFPSLLGGTGNDRLGEQEKKAKFYYEQMRFTNKVIADLDAQGVTIDAGGEAVRQLMILRGGGVVSAAGKTLAFALRQVLSPDQLRLVDATLAGANAFRYLVSGQQTSDAEFSFIMSYLMPVVGDPPDVRDQKAAFRQMVERSAREVFEGTSTGSAAVGSLLRMGQTLGWDPQVLQSLKALQEGAVRHERSGGHATQPLILNRNPADPNDPATLDWITNRIDEIGNAVERSERLRIMGIP